MHNRVKFLYLEIGKPLRHYFPHNVPHIRFPVPVLAAYPNGQITPLRVAAPVLKRNAAAVYVQRHAEIAIYQIGFFRRHSPIAPRQFDALSEYPRNLSPWQSFHSGQSTPLQYGIVSAVP